MRSGQRLELRQSQQLVMTPRLQQAIRLLQMSRLEAEAFLASEVEKNPALKIDDGAGEAPAPAAEVRSEGLDQVISREDHQEAAGALEAVADNLYEAAERPLMRGPAGGSAGFAGDQSLPEPGEMMAGAISLREHLLPQIAAAARPGAVRSLASLLVDELDENGWLRTDISALSARLGAQGAICEEAVALLQSCEPTGVGARSLEECLALQLRERGRYSKAMAALLAHLPELAAAKMSRLRAVCGVSDAELRAMIGEIRGLNPRPGVVFTSAPAQAVTPDVFVRRTASGGWRVEVNAEALPRILLDTAYLTEMTAGGAETEAFTARCRQDADWLLRALDQRAQTILKVATEITRRQSGFFEHGASALEPMTLKQVAEEVGVHELTVSRVTSNKFLSCGRGVFEMRFFFTQGLPAADGGDFVSSAAIQYKIRHLIDNEGEKMTLSDDQIVTLLKQSGMDVARRTVAKYRSKMSIPSSAQRKRLKLSAAI